MAAARSFRTTLHEVWADAVPQIGGASQLVQTSILFRPGENDENVDADLRLVSVTGTPLFAMTYSSVGGFLAITVANNAGGGAANQATWTLDVRFIHSIVQ
jgi:hypothetical protein